MARVIRMATTTASILARAMASLTSLPGQTLTRRTRDDTSRLSLMHMSRVLAGCFGAGRLRARQSGISNGY